MEWIKRLNQAVSCIEEHLTEEIRYEELERRIAAEWLPTSGYEFADAPDIEVYFEPNPEDTHYEVWVPVRRA